MDKTLVIFGLLCCLAACGLCEKYGGGQGTADDPYLIASVEQLVDFGNTPDDYDAHFLLVNDLDMAGTVYTKAVIAPDLDRREWGPQGRKFNGTFDGGGHKISNFTAENSSIDYLALFGFSGKNAVIKNLHIVDASVHGNNMVSCLIAGLEGTVENCSVTGKLSGNYVIGGMVGFLDNASILHSRCEVIIASNSGSRFDMVGGLVASSQFGKIDHCFAKCTIDAGENKFHVGGGFIGSNRNGTITNSYCDEVSIVAKAGASSMGGFCGHNAGSIRNCLAFDFQVQCKGDSIGGLVGSNDSLIAMSVAEGQVVGMSGIGGIAGRNDGYIIDSYSNVTSAAVDKVGGFAGRNTYSILRSYSIGKAVGVSERAGGFVGENTGLIDLSCWDVEKSRIDFDVAAVPQRTSELRKKTTFKYWGNGVWLIDEDNDYPRLAWENTPGVVIEDEPVEYGGGSGTADDPYLIYDAKSLTMIGVYPQDIEKHFKLMADIDMQGVEFKGIGYGFGFGGVFEGNGHVIRNYAVKNDLAYSGLFTVILQTGIVRNLVVEGFQVSGSRSVGGLCGKNEGLIQRCKIAGTVEARHVGKQRTNWGGLVGSNFGRIVECVSDIKINVVCDGMSCVGGFAGVNSGKIERSGSRGEIVCSGRRGTYVGGFMGMGGYDSQVFDCYSHVAITVTGEECRLVGGFAGGQGFRTTIRRSYCSAPMVLAGDCKDSAAFIGYVAVVEFAAHSRITDSFWNVDHEGPALGIARQSPAQIIISGVTGEQLKNLKFLEDAGWEVSMVPNEKIWFLESGQLPRIYLP